VTHSFAKPSPQTPHRLRTFGGLALADAESNTLLGTHSQQRNRLALLAVLAAAGSEGRSRDQLLVLFWPDATQKRARHSLEQLVYAMRTTIHESTFAGVNPLRLNPEVITSDVDDFQLALKRGELEQAVAAYHGPFLDGFYFGDSPEFEQWLDAQRSRLKQRYCSALESLAKNAESSGDHANAVHWWRKLAEADPVSSNTAAGVVRALMNAGNHPSALQHAEEYKVFVEQEIGTGTGPIVAGLVAKMRADAVKRSSEDATHAVISSPARAAEAAGTIPYAFNPGQSRPLPRRFAFYAVASLAIVLAIAAIASDRAPTRSATGPAAGFPAHRSTANVAAYELYRRGSDPSLLRSDSGARAGLEYFRQAVALDPNYAEAFAGLARLHKRLAFGDDRELSRRDRLALAEQAALKAVSLDASSADGYATLSIVRREMYQMESAEAELKRAIALEPTNPRFREYMVQQDVLMDRAPHALIEANRAIELDPLGPTAIAELAHALLANHRCDDALAQLGKLKSLNPPMNRAATIAAQCYARKQMWSEAIAEMRSVLPNAGPRGQAVLGYMLGRAGELKEANQILDMLVARSRRINGGAFDVALVYFGLGDSDRGFRWLDRAVDDRSVGFEWLPTVVEDLRPDSRFDRIRHRLGIVQD
jgi:DNA-binding SARP family transcriptional activator